MSGANPRTIEAAVPLLLVSLPIDDPIAGDQMSTSPTNQIERNRGTADRKNPVASLLCCLSTMEVQAQDGQSHAGLSHHPQQDQFLHEMFYSMPFTASH
jgi:hypothetical protein